MTNDLGSIITKSKDEISTYKHNLKLAEVLQEIEEQKKKDMIARYEGQQRTGMPPVAPMSRPSAIMNDSLTNPLNTALAGQAPEEFIDVTEQNDYQNLPSVLAAGASPATRGTAQMPRIPYTADVTNVGGVPMRFGRPFGKTIAGALQTGEPMSAEQEEEVLRAEYETGRPAQKAMAAEELKKKGDTKMALEQFRWQKRFELENQKADHAAKLAKAKYEYALRLENAKDKDEYIKEMRAMSDDLTGIMAPSSPDIKKVIGTLENAKSKKQVDNQMQLLRSTIDASGERAFVQLMANRLKYWLPETVPADTQYDKKKKLSEKEISTIVIEAKAKHNAGIGLDQIVELLSNEFPGEAIDWRNRIQKAK